MIKKISIVILSSLIFLSSVLSSYRSVYAFDIPTAFWGTLEASRAFWTAMQAGGGINNGGVSLSAFERSSREDVKEFQTQVLIAYNAFCIWKKKLEIKINHPDWDESQVSTQSQLEGRLASDRFVNSSINVNDTTKNLSLTDYGYWKEFCNKFDFIAKNGIGGSIGSDTSVIAKTFNNGGYELTNNIANGSSTIEYNGKYYVNSSKLFHLVNNRWVVEDYEVTDVPTDRVRIPYLYFVYLYDNVCSYELGKLDINRLTGQVISFGQTPIGNVAFSEANVGEFVNAVIRKGNTFPVVLNVNTNQSNYLDNIVRNYDTNFSVNISGVSSSEEYEQLISQALNNTEAGKAVKEGANEGERPIVGTDSVPIKRSSLKSGESEATGAIGWDIPDSRALEGAIANPKEEDDVIKGMGIISVPQDQVIPKNAEETVVAWDKDIPVTIPDTVDVPITVPVDDVISEQFGEFYPKPIALGDFFPFCIPFDIYYCVQKFNVSSGEAPIIHIPIVYPNALKGVLGESYDVIIDFNNYIALRNIIRAFILIFFLIGLMQITRNLIRG